MIFAHLSDTHLGYRQYGLYQREEDYYNVFEDIVESIIEKRPDFVIHSGDLFEFSRPPTRALLQVQKGLLSLKEAGIPVFAIAGNHDIIMRKNALPPHLLYKEFGLKIISPQKPHYIYQDVFIGGSPYISKYHADTLKENLKTLESQSRDYDKRILVLHQGIDKYLPFEYELELADIPESFNYYALGHVHSRIVDDFGEGKLAYPGSTEIWKMDEVGNYQKKGKGYYLVDLEDDSVEPVNITLPREFIKARVEYSNRKEEIESLKTHIQALDAQPILHLTVEGGNFSRSEVYEEINKALSSLVLSLRPNFQVESLESESTTLKDETLDVRTILKKRLNEMDSDAVTNLGLSLLKEISEGRMENAEEISQKFYEEFYDH